MRLRALCSVSHPHAASIQRVYRIPGAASWCRYEVIKASGKGVFSNVVTAIDKLRQNSEGVNPLVAIKVIRANDTMYKAGKLELQILTKLAEADPENRRHVIRLLRSFEYRHHLCMVRCQGSSPGCTDACEVHAPCMAFPCRPPCRMTCDCRTPLSCLGVCLGCVAGVVNR